MRWAVELAAGIAVGALLVRERRSRQRADRFAAAGLESLLRAIDANDPHTGVHARRVAEYALVITDALGVDDESRRTIELTALFHDIGKIHEALFDIVHEPRKLTPSERRAIATHPRRGAEVLAPVASFYPELAEAVLAHHENWDGTGYPRGLQFEKIPLPARIVAIVDTFDAITYRRRYRDARAVLDAADIIQQGRGTQFDPALVDLLMLPPIFARLTRARRKWARIGDKVPNRAQGIASDEAPRIRIRWRSKSDAPVRVREKMSDATLS
jgi:putative nucleotidyltransferase with HDIG domain